MLKTGLPPGLLSHVSTQYIHTVSSRSSTPGPQLECESYESQRRLETRLRFTVFPFLLGCFNRRRLPSSPDIPSLPSSRPPPQEPDDVQAPQSSTLKRYH
ncbi:unnamed protein product [Pleuronectes platessa]|uniref:Uncharacterized protein n=1 Tax=Pleuronectes platessa TaxID=8262 RepID=A0A9N7VTJ7_PLEPL|nr:unnamed protein product [Pleuronectes platessa]